MLSVQENLLQTLSDLTPSVEDASPRNRQSGSSGNINSTVSLKVMVWHTCLRNLYRDAVIRRQGEMFPLRIDTVEAVEI